MMYTALDYNTGWREFGAIAPPPIMPVGATRPHTPRQGSAATPAPPARADAPRPCQRETISATMPVVMPMAYEKKMGITTGICQELRLFAGGPGARCAPGGEREGPSPLARQEREGRSPLAPGQGPPPSALLHI